jgi:ABC-2 type transport system permease protein
MPDWKTSTSRRSRKHDAQRETRAMLRQIARFEFHYVLRNPLLWVTAALTFALFFLAMAIGGFQLGAEGGILENAAIATLRDYLMASVLFMFVTTSFVANAVLRDDETGFGPIIRSTSITKFDYLMGRFLGAFAVAAVCILLVAPAIWLGSAISWADPATIGPNRIANHLYGLFVIALPNIAAEHPHSFRRLLRTRDDHALDDGHVSRRHRFSVRVLLSAGLVR